MFDDQAWRVRVIPVFDASEISAGIFDFAVKDGEREVIGREHGRTLVVVKPNWIQESCDSDKNQWSALITDPGLLGKVVESVVMKPGFSGEICLCDAPHTYADFEKIINRGNLKQDLGILRRSYGGCDLTLMDLRREIWVEKDGVIVARSPNVEDPRGYCRLNLGRGSMFFNHRGQGRYYGADYDCKAVNLHHVGETQEYLISGTVMASDLFVNVPKLKTHKKTGVSVALKNLVGVNGDKNWLPHHTMGTSTEGGDEYPSAGLATRVESALKGIGQRVALSSTGPGAWLYRKVRRTGISVLGDSSTKLRNGNWEGNDTCWRMVLDLNRALLYGNPDGTWREAGSAKPCFIVVDGIVGGEGNGPLSPDPVASNVVVLGTNPAAVDAVCCRLMGFDPDKIPVVREAFSPHRWPIADFPMRDIEVHDERAGRLVALDEIAPAVPGGFKPHFGWPGLATSR